MAVNYTPRVPITTPMFDEVFDEQGNLLSKTMNRTWVLFFERFGKPGADGEPGAAAVAPGAVTFIDLVQEDLVDDQGVTYIHVVATYDPPTPIGTFTGVDIDIEAPDASTIVVPVGSWAYNGIEAAVDATRYGTVDMDFYPSKDEDWRFYLSSHSEFVRNTLILHPDAAETPNMVITVVAAPGTAPVLPGSLQDITGLDFLISVAETEPNGDGLRQQRYTIEYDPPDPVLPLQGVAVDVQTPDQVSVDQATAVGNQEYNGDPGAIDDTRHGIFTLDIQFAEHAGETWTFYLSPYSANYRTPLDLVTTPHRSITALSAAAGPEGIEWADQITGYTVVAEYEYVPTMPGWRWRFYGVWTNPTTDTRFAGTKHVIRQHPAPSPADGEDRVGGYYGPLIESFTTEWFLLAEPFTEWDNFQPSIDILGRENTLSLTAVGAAELCPVDRVEVSEDDAIASLGLTRGYGLEFASNVSGYSVAVIDVWNDVLKRQEYYLHAEWTNPTVAADPRFAGLDLIIRIAGEEDRIMPIFYETVDGPPTGTQEFDWGKGIDENWTKQLVDVDFTMFWRSFDWAGNANSINTTDATGTNVLTPFVDDEIPAIAPVGLITSFSVEARYGDNGASLIIDPTFTPPAGDDSFYYAELWMKNPRWSGQLSEMAQSHDLAIIGENFPPTIPEDWDFWAVSVSFDGRKNPAAFDPDTAAQSGSNYATEEVDPAPVLGLPTPPDLPTDVDVTVPTSRQNAYTGQLELQLHIEITYGGSSTADGVQVYLTRDSTASPPVWEWVSNNIAYVSAPQIIDDWVDAPPVTLTHARIKVITWNEVWNDPDISLASGAVSADFVMPAAATLANNLITNATVVSALAYTRNNVGVNTWGFSFTWTNPTDPQFKATRCKVQKFDAVTGVASTDDEGELREFIDRDGLGRACRVDVAKWDIPAPGDKYRITLYCVNQLMVETLQNAWTVSYPAHPSYLELAPVEPAFGGAGTTVAPVSASFTGVAAVGDYTEAGGQEYYFVGTSIPPAGVAFQGQNIYAAPRGTMSATNGLTTYGRVSGPFFTAQHVGQVIDLGGTQILIAAVNTSTQVITAQTWAGATGGAYTSVLLGESRLLRHLDPTETNYTSDRHPIQHASETFRLYPLSIDAVGRENSYAAGVTPFVDVTVVRTSGATSATTYAPLVTSVVSLDSATNNVFSFASGLGATQCLIRATFVEPTTSGIVAANYGGVKGVRLSNPTGAPGVWLELFDIPAGSTGSATSQPLDSGTGAAAFTVGFLSYDKQGRANPYVHGTTPAFTATFPAQLPTLNLAYVSPGSLVTASIAAGIRAPVIVTSLPALPNAALYPGGSTVFLTTSQSLWKTNTGSSWIENVGSNDLQANAATFGKVAAAAISVVQLRVEEFLVGSGGGKPTRFRVDDGFGGMLAFIGYIPSGTLVNTFPTVNVSGDFSGAYFDNVRIGNNINFPFFYADGNAIRIGPAAATSPNIYIDASQCIFTNTAITINSGNGLTVNTNSLITRINNQIYAGFGYALDCSDPAGNSARIRPGVITVVTAGGSPRVELIGTTSAAGTIAIYDSSGQQRWFWGTTGSGQGAAVALNDRFGSTWTGYPNNGQTATVTVSRPGGTATFTILAGQIVNVTLA